MNLEEEIAGWDKKSADSITDIYNRYVTEPEFIEELLFLIIKPALQTGSTWLLKRCLERQDDTIRDGRIMSIYQHLELLDDWESRLHVLQCMAYLPVHEQYKDQVEKFVLENTKSENKFVRAWAYGGYYNLAKNFPELQEEMEKLLTHALTYDPAASVKSRIRNIMKKNS